MSRKSYPTRLCDHSGNEIRLEAKPFATGGEGAVFDVVGRPDLVAKLYSKPQSKERCEKLSAMATLCSQELLKIAAWPTATLSTGGNASVEGILMPRIVDHKEIHHLYSVAQRKKDFPEVDWGFLLHTARNCAIAFECVHRHGHVVGDVNQKNVMVSRKGIVALVDCDSFQVRQGNRVFRCGVGVPEYTPPELHGRKFADLDREASHDLFGLAVMIFHLLMMGRHPFAGVPQGNFDIPIDNAIRDGLYAYSRNSTKLKPPPHVAPLEMLDDATRDLFERAFRSNRRPTATEWRGVLDNALGRIQRCKNDRKHAYLSGASCPWCQLIAVARLMFFIPSQSTTNAPQKIEDIRLLIEKLKSLHLSFGHYSRPKVLLPVTVNLPAGVRSVKKPALLPYPDPLPPLDAPKLKLYPAPPSQLPHPVLRPLPAPPDLPPAPQLRQYPPVPANPPRPRLHEVPPPPVHTSFLDPGPPDRFLEILSFYVGIVGCLLYFVAPPVGVIVVLGFGSLWVYMKATVNLRRDRELHAAQRRHQFECEELEHAYRERIRPIEAANQKALKRWEAENVSREREHAARCRKIDDENRVTLAPWESVKFEIESEYRKSVLEVEQANLRTMLDWELEESARKMIHDEECRKIQVENQRLTLDWQVASEARADDHRRKCEEIKAINQRRIADWEVANAPWANELKSAIAKKVASEAEILKLESDLLASRQAAIGTFSSLHQDSLRLVKTHDGIWSDYRNELQRAESESTRIQLEEHLDRSLIRTARLKGMTSERILSLESFGIETAKDVEILIYQKVPGIGPVLSQRLFDWRYKISSSFRPRKGLPQAEKDRIASRYSPVCLPLEGPVQSSIRHLEGMMSSFKASDAQRVQAIAKAVQDLASAEAQIKAMSIV